MIIFGRSDILRKDNLVSKSLFGIFTCVPVVLTLEGHYLFDSFSVYPFEIFVMQIFIELLTCFFVLLFPGEEIGLKSKTFLSNFFSEITLIIEMPEFHFLCMFMQILIFDHLLILFGLNVYFLSGLSHSFSVKT